MRAREESERPALGPKCGCGGWPEGPESELAGARAERGWEWSPRIGNRELYAGRGRSCRKAWRPSERGRPRAQGARFEGWGAIWEWDAWRGRVYSPPATAHSHRPTRARPRLRFLSCPRGDSDSDSDWRRLATISSPDSSGLDQRCPCPRLPSLSFLAPAFVPHPCPRCPLLFGKAQRLPV